MKKLLSLTLALIIAMSLSVVGFARENVDNTFDNFNPAPGVQAPDNWYDPLSYDDDGTINRQCVQYDGPSCMYCRKTGKVFDACTPVDVDATHVIFPYETLYEGPNYFDEYVSKEVFYCPYCGEINTPLSNNAYSQSHYWIDGVVHGYHCPDCGKFNASHCEFADGESYFCRHCGGWVIPEALYRFTTDEQKNSEYSHIFEESAYKFIDGTDYRVEDLKKSKWGGYDSWKYDPIDQPNAFVRFFRNIGDMFRNFFKWIASWFK